MNSRYMRRQVIRIAMSVKEMNKMDVAKALDWSYPTTLKKLENPSKLTVTDAERLCDLIDLDIIKFISSEISTNIRELTGALNRIVSYSRIYNKPVLEILIPRLSNTLVLMGSSLILALVFAIPMGIWAAIRPRSHIDFIIN